MPKNNEVLINTNYCEFLVMSNGWVLHGELRSFKDIS